MCRLVRRPRNNGMTLRWHSFLGHSFRFLAWRTVTRVTGSSISLYRLPTACNNLRRSITTLTSPTDMGDLVTFLYARRKSKVNPNRSKRPRLLKSRNSRSQNHISPHCPHPTGTVDNQKAPIICLYSKHHESGEDCAPQGCPERCL